MLIRRLSKGFVLSLLMAVCFSFSFSFTARADFDSTDSSNLSNIKTNVNTIKGDVSTIKTEIVNSLSEIKDALYSASSSITDYVVTIASRTSTIITRLTTTNTYLSNLETDILSTNNKLDTIISNMSGNSGQIGILNQIQNTIATGNTIASGTQNLVNNLGTPINSIDTKIGTTNTRLNTANSHLSNIKAGIDTLNTTATAISDTTTYISQLLEEIYKNTSILYDNISVPRTREGAYTVRLTLNYDLRAEYDLGVITVGVYTYDASDRSLTYSTVQRYVNWAGYWNMRLNTVTQLLNGTYKMVKAYFTDTVSILTNTYNMLTAKLDMLYILADNIAVTRYTSNSTTARVNTYDGYVEYDLQPIVMRSFSYSQAHVFGYDTVTRYCNFNGLVYAHLRVLGEAFASYFGYLADQSPANTISNSVTSLSNNLTSLNQAETAASDDAITRIGNFVPDISSISSLVALSWCSTFLQNLYLALGTFNVPILCGLVLGVCMQFIGYFRYKT